MRWLNAMLDRTIRFKGRVYVSEIGLQRISEVVKPFTKLILEDVFFVEGPYNWKFFEVLSKTVTEMEIIGNFAIGAYFAWCLSSLAIFFYL